MTFCQSCLKPVEKKGFCPSCLRKLFRGISPQLKMTPAQFHAERYDQIDHFSLSGVQDKISMKLQKNRLVATTFHGEYILKPIPSQSLPQYQDDLPANEHLTMQIASQLFGINTAQNALVFFTDGEPAYLTRRFDVSSEGKLRQEDFCQLGGLSPENAGRNFKYEKSYQFLGTIIQRYCSAAPFEMEKLFRRVLFNYLFGNGDAHAKNFSLLESKDGDFLLSPAYDLINTSIHFPQKNRMALDLFDDFETEHYRKNGFYGYDDFMQLSKFYGLLPRRTNALFDLFSKQHNLVIKLVSHSFLSFEAKQKYLTLYHDKIKALTH